MYNTVCACVCVLYRKLTYGRKQTKGQKPAGENKTVTMSLATTHVAMATNAIWLTVGFFFFFYYQHSTNLSSGQSYALAGVISCITEQALCT